MARAVPTPDVALEEDRSGEHGTGSGGTLPTCTNCGRDPAPEAYTLRFERQERRDRVVDLQLCHGCLDDICSESGVRMV